MKKEFICLILLIGLFVMGFSSPPPDTAKQTDQLTEFVQISFVDQVSMQTTFINAVDPIALPAPDTPALNVWMIEVPAVSTLAANCELSKHKMLSFNDIYDIKRSCELVKIYIPDKSKNGGSLSIRDKLYFG